MNRLPQVLDGFTLADVGLLLTRPKLIALISDIQAN
jgi:hypothetical protein